MEREEWVCVGVQFDGRVFGVWPKTWVVSSKNVESDRTIDDGWWKNILNLPSLVVIEWQQPPSPDLNQFFIYVKQ